MKQAGPRGSVDGLPRSQSQMESKTPEQKTQKTTDLKSQTSASKTMSSTMETTSQKTWGPLTISSTAKKDTKTTIMSNPSKKERSFDENDFSKWADLSLTGFLNLRDLNTLLLKYIGVAHELEESQGGTEDNSMIDIDIKESEIVVLDQKYKDEVDAWKKLWNEADARIKALKAQIQKLEAEKKELEKLGKEKDAKLEEKNKIIADLRAKIADIQAKLSAFLCQQEIFDAELARLHAELAYLTGEINAYTSLYDNEKLRSSDLEDKKNSLEQELRFKISVLEAELTTKTERSSVDTTSMEVRIKGEFAARLKIELRMLRNMFEESMRVNKEKFEMQYRAQITQLELDLSLAISQQSSPEDLDEIRAQIKKFEASISQLRGKNDSLSQGCSKITVELKKQETSFTATMTKREREIEHLKKENARIIQLYEELSSRLMMTKAEVGVYDRLITPELDRITARPRSTPSSPNPKSLMVTKS